nr:hypothetical protein CFP56_20248 [Quercus suber]
MTSLVAGAPLTEIGHHKHNNTSFEKLASSPDNQRSCHQPPPICASSRAAFKPGCPERRSKYGYRVHFCGSDGHRSAPFTKDRYRLVDYDIKDPVKHLPTCHRRCFNTELKRLLNDHPNFNNDDNLLLCHRSCYHTTL